LPVFFFQAEDGIRDRNVTGVQTCALPILTWLLVTMCPSLLQTVPVPPLHLPAPTRTTDRETFSVTSTIASEIDSSIADEFVCLLIFSPYPCKGWWNYLLTEEPEAGSQRLGEREVRIE